MKIEKLTLEQESKLSCYREKWLNKIFNYELYKSISVEHVQHKMKELYKFCNLKEPIVILVDSPMACQFVPLFFNQVLNQVENQIRNQIENQVLNQVWNRVRSQIRDQAWDQVGDQVENQVGNQVGNQIRNQIRNQVGNQVEDQVWNQVWNQVGTQVGNQVWNRVLTQVRNQIESQVWNQVLNQVESQVWNQVRNQVRNQVGNQVKNQVESQVWNQVRTQVGTQVRNQVGTQVWDQVEDQVANQVKNQAWDQVGDQVWDQVRNQVLNQVWDQVRTQIESQVRNQIESQVWDQVEDQVRDQVWNQVRTQVWNQVRTQVWNQVWNQVGTQVENQVWNQVSDQVEEVWDQVEDQVSDQVEDQVRNQVRNQVWNQVEDQVWNQIENQVRNQVKNQVEDQKLTYFLFSSYINFSDFGWLSFYDFFLNELDILKDHKDNLNQLISFVECSFMSIQLDNLCIVSRYPSFISRNSQNELHNLLDHAIQFKDGYGQHYFNGIYVSPELFQKLISKTYSFEEWTLESNEEIKSLVLSFYEEKFGGEFVYKFLSNVLFEINTFVDKKEEQYLKNTTKGMNIGVYTLFKGRLNNTDIAYVRCYCPSTDRIFFLGVDPENTNAKDAIASLCQVPDKLKEYLISISRQGEMFSFNFNEIGTNLLKTNSLTKDDLNTVISLTGDEYFNKIKFEY